MIKVFLKYLLILVILIIIMLFLLFLFHKKFLPNEEYLQIVCEAQKTHLTSLPSNFVVPDKLTPQVLEVLNSYPELQNENIVFGYKKEPSTMVTQPKINYRLLTGGKRTYCIFINNYFKGDRKTFDFDTLKYEYQVAWIAHEFGHIVDYRSRTVVSIAGFGVNYLLRPKFKSVAEKFGHKSAIYHGFGTQTLHSTIFARSSPSISQSYINDMKKYHYSIEEMESLNAHYKDECNK